MSIQTILVPYDFSAHAEYALTWALELAEKSKAKILLLHVVPALSSFSLVERLSALDVQHIEAHLIAEAEQRLGEIMVTRRPASVTIEARTLIGNPFTEICRVTEDERADLIVIGSHGRTGLARVLLGSVAERVLQHAPCPVFVARLPASSGTH